MESTLRSHVQVCQLHPKRFSWLAIVFLHVHVRHGMRQKGHLIPFVSHVGGGKKLTKDRDLIKRVNEYRREATSTG